MRRTEARDKLPDLSAVGEIDSILIIKYRALGDIVLVQPLVYALREAFPKARISFLCMENFVETLADNPAVDEVISFKGRFLSELKLFLKLRNKRYDLVLDLISSPFSAYLTYMTRASIRIGFDVGRQSWCYTNLLPRVIVENGERKRMYTFDSNLKLLEMMNIPCKPAAYEGIIGRVVDAVGQVLAEPDSRYDRYAVGFPPAEAEKRWAEDYLKKINPDGLKVVGIVPSARYQAKAWPVEKFVELAGGLAERGNILPVIIWGPGEKDVAERIAAEVPEVVVIPEIGVAKLGALISILDLLVGVDSGPKHIAVLLGVPTLTLFGPTDPVIWDPLTDIHRVIYLNLPCSPCNRKSCNPNRCLLDIEADEVINEALILLGKVEGKKEK